DGSGNFVLVGSFAGNVDFGGGALVSSFGSTDAYVAKFTSAGTHVWSKRYGTSGIDAALGVTVDGDGNVGVTGSFHGGVDFGTGTIRSVDASDDIFVMKTSPAGQTLWARGYGNEFGDFGNAVAADQDGNLLVTGSFRETVDFGGGPLMAHGNTPADI